MGHSVQLLIYRKELSNISNASNKLISHSHRKLKIFGRLQFWAQLSFRFAAFLTCCRDGRLVKVKFACNVFHVTQHLIYLNLQLSVQTISFFYHLSDSSIRFGLLRSCSVDLWLCHHLQENGIPCQCHFMEQTAVVFDACFGTLLDCPNVQSLSPCRKKQRIGTFASTGKVSDLIWGSLPACHLCYQNVQTKILFVILSQFQQCILSTKMFDSEVSSLRLYSLIAISISKQQTKLGHGFWRSTIIIQVRNG